MIQRARVWSLVAAVGSFFAAAAVPFAPVHARAVAADVACPPPGRVAVLPLGDSVTYGVGSSTGHNSYRLPLYYRMTGTAGVDFGFGGYAGSDAGGAHEGHPGWTVQQLIDRVDPVLSLGGFNYVIVQGGLNDAGQAIDPTRIADRLGQLVDKILAYPCIRGVIVMSPNPVYTTGINSHGVDTRAESRWDRQVGKDLPAVLASRDQSRVELVRSDYLGIGDESGGSHPNDVGYDKLSYLLYIAMEKWLGTLPSTGCPCPAPALFDR